MASTRTLSGPPAKRQRKGQSDGAAEENGATKKSPLVVLAHGAGAPSSSEWMTRWKRLLEKELQAIAVITFDYPYIAGGKRKAPPKAEKLVEFHKGIVKDAVSNHPGHPLILAGKSMGSRISCMVALEEEVDVTAVVCLGYPLKGMNGKVRDETLLQLDVPIMFVQGSKDSLCPLGMLENTQKKMKGTNESYVIDGGDHSFKIGKKHLESTGVDQKSVEEAAAKAVAQFVGKCILEA